MHRRTSRYLDALRLVVRTNYPAWRARYPNIVGVHVGNKIRDGQRKRYYAVVFHVTSKACNLKARERVPPKISVNVPGHGRKRVPTDIVATGTLELHSGAVSIGDFAKSIHSSDYGTISCFVARHNELYVLSNMHVLGVPHLRNGARVFYRPIAEQAIRDVELGHDGAKVFAYLERGIFSGIDAAIARITTRESIANRIPGWGAPSGLVKLDNGSYRDFPVRLYGARSRRVQNTAVHAIGVQTTASKYGMEIEFKNLIMLEGAVTASGDSGAIVFDRSRFIVGIAIGGDSGFTYAMPIAEVLDYFEAELVTGASV